jgi:hypothetical protein
MPLQARETEVLVSVVNMVEGTLDPRAQIPWRMRANEQLEYCLADRPRISLSARIQLPPGSEHVHEIH